MFPSIKTQKHKKKTALLWIMWEKAQNVRGSQSVSIFHRLLRRFLVQIDLMIKLTVCDTIEW